MKDILLLNLPVTSLRYKSMMQLASRSFPCGLGSLSGTLKAAGHSFSVLDADALDMPLDKMISAVVTERPRIIGISTYSSYADITQYVIEEIKKSFQDCLVVLGGHHAFAASHRLLNETNADIVAVGEGELLFAEVCDAILHGKDLENVKGICFRKHGNIVRTADRDCIKDLDKLPMPAYEYFPMDKYQGHFWRRWVSGYRKTFVQEYDDRFARQYGFWRPYIGKVIYRYLDCGDLRHGFARVKCKDCGHEYLLAFSCKRRHFCPSCHQKRVVEFGEWLCMDVLKKITHRHYFVNCYTYFLSGNCSVLVKRQKWTRFNFSRRT